MEETCQRGVGVVENSRCTYHIRNPEDGGPQVVVNNLVVE